MDKYKCEKQFRYSGYDYAQDGWYFVTICTEDKINYFGEVMFENNSGQVALSAIGRAANAYWNAIPAHFPFVRLDEYMIMPDHIHGIIVIDRANDRRNEALPRSRDSRYEHCRRNEALPRSVGNCDKYDVLQNGVRRCVGRYEAVPRTYGGAHPRMSDIFPKAGSLAVIIGSFKSVVTKHANQHNIPFAWQPRFYDRIIRNQKELDKIRNYIINNPDNWAYDTGENMM